MNKRQYNSPIQAAEKKLCEYHSSVSSEEIWHSPVRPQMSSMIQKVLTEVTTKNGEVFLNPSLRIEDTKELWQQVSGLSFDVVFGVAIIKTKTRGVGVNFKLKEPIELDISKFNSFSFQSGSDVYKGKQFEEQGPPPSLGEPILVNVNRTGWHLEDNQIVEWLSLFGTLDSKIEYKDYESLPVKMDSLSVMMRLRKHIPGTLPAYGKRMYVSYRGQPRQCGKCMELGHIRSDCNGEKMEWSTYVKALFKSGYIGVNLLGKWSELLKN
jgi:hypothetical protein